jgi:hypothetical protein
VPTISVNRRPWKVRLAVAGSRVALDRVEIWKQLQGTPQRISELEKRVAELEGKDRRSNYGSARLVPASPDIGRTFSWLPSLAIP